MVKCAIRGCRNNYDKTKNLGSEKIGYFRFPKNEFCGEWVRLCGNPCVKTSIARVCSIHFSDTAYRAKRWIEKQLPDYPSYARRLKDDAVPSKFLPIKFASTGSKSVLNEIDESQAKENSSAAQNDINSSLVFVNSETEDLIPAASFELKNVDKQNLQLNFHLQELEELKKKNANLIKTLELKNKLIGEKDKIIAKKERILEKNEKLLNQKNIIISKAHREEEKFEKILNDIFTPGQVKMLIDGKRKQVKWNADDISSAMSLYSVSPRAYRYLRNTKKIPFPSISTLRNWARKLDVTPGILKDVLRIMKMKGENMTESEKLAVLSYDEVYMSNDISIDRKEEGEVVGPYKTVQVVMARGIVKKWKQLVFYDFDRAMNKKLLNDIIQQLYESEFTVVAITSDLGLNNKSIKNDNDNGDEDSERCYFEHPSNKELRIHVFADVPLLMKLARNHLLDQGFLYKRVHISITVLEQILQYRAGENDITTAHNLTKNHLTVKDPEQRVRLAVQVLSKSVADSIESFGRKGFIKNWEIISEVVRLYNNWFDIFNSQKMYDKLPELHAYGMELDYQNKILRDMNQFVKEMRIPEHESMMPFQEGISLCCNSLPSMFEYLKEKYGIKYLITHRLNQDVLENTFSFLRHMGGNNDHPNALGFQHRLKCYILGKHSTDVFSIGSNTVSVEKDSSLIDAQDVSSFKDNAYTVTNDFPQEEEEDSELMDWKDPEELEAEKMLKDVLVKEKSEEFTDLESLMFSEEFQYCLDENDDVEVKYWRKGKEEP